MNFLTFSLLHSDMRQSEHGEESLFILQLWCSVHLFRGEACAELRRRRRSAFWLQGRWWGAALPEHPPPLPSLLMHQLIPPAHCGQAKHSQKVQFLCRGKEEKKIILLQFSVMSAWVCFHHREHRKCICVGRCFTSVESSSLSGGCSDTLLRWALTSSSSLSSYESSSS